MEDVPPPPDGVAGSDTPPPPNGIEGFNTPPPPDGVAGSDTPPPPNGIEGFNTPPPPTDDLEPNLPSTLSDTGDSQKQSAPAETELRADELSSQSRNETVDISAPRRSRKPALALLVLAVCGGIWAAAQTDSDVDADNGELNFVGLSDDEVSTTLATPTTTAPTPTTTAPTPTTTAPTPTTTLPNIPGGDSSGASFSGVVQPESGELGDTLRVTGTFSWVGGWGAVWLQGAIDGVGIDCGSNRHVSWDPPQTSATFDLTCVMPSGPEWVLPPGRTSWAANMFLYGLDELGHEAGLQFLPNIYPP